MYYNYCVIMVISYTIYRKQTATEQKIIEHLKDAKKTKKPPKQTKKGRPKKKPADDLRLQQEAAWMFQVFVLVHVYACVHSRCMYMYL